MNKNQTFALNWKKNSSKTFGYEPISVGLGIIVFPIFQIKPSEIFPVNKRCAQNYHYLKYESLQTIGHLRLVGSQGRERGGREKGVLGKVEKMFGMGKLTQTMFKAIFKFRNKTLVLDEIVQIFFHNIVSCSSHETTLTLRLLY